MDNVPRIYGQGVDMSQKKFNTELCVIYLQNRLIFLLDMEIETQFDMIHNANVATVRA